MSGLNSAWVYERACMLGVPWSRHALGVHPVGVCVRHSLAEACPRLAALGILWSRCALGVQPWACMLGILWPRSALHGRAALLGVHTMHVLWAYRQCVRTVVWT